jgi:hypothetical protein
MPTKTRPENPPSVAVPPQEPDTGPDTPSGAGSAHSPVLTVSAEDPEEAARLVQNLVARRPISPEWDAAQFEDRPLTVWEAIAEVTRQVDAIAKTGRASGSDGGYAFRGIDQVLEALHPILGEVGLVILPGTVVREEFSTRATKSGGTLNVARLLVRYTLIGPDGTREAGEVWGEAGDSGDKATQKAHSQSYKSFTLQTFSIPTQQSADDEPDAVNESARPFTADEVHRAMSAAQAAEGAGSVEALASVRRRALALLSVPIPLEDGSVAPLSILFDQRLASLDQTGEPR